MPDKNQNETEPDYSKFSDEEFSDLVDKVIDALHEEIWEDDGEITPITPEEEAEAVKRLTAYPSSDEDEPQGTR